MTKERSLAVLEQDSHDRRQPDGAGEDVPGVTTGEHPVNRLERAALEYAKAAARSSGADIRAERYTGNRGARAAVLAAKARRHKIDCSTLLQCAANAFSDWSSRR